MRTLKCEPHKLYICICFMVQWLQLYFVVRLKGRVHINRSVSNYVILVNDQLLRYPQQQFCLQTVIYMKPYTSTMCEQCDKCQQLIIQVGKHTTIVASLFSIPSMKTYSYIFLVLCNKCYKNYKIQFTNTFSQLQVQLLQNSQKSSNIPSSSTM